MNDAACCVCGSILAQDRASCYGCGQEFHLALRIDRQAPDCGDTWIDDESQALFFMCNVCLGRAEAPRRVYRRSEGLGARELARARAKPAPRRPRGGR